MLSSSVYSTSAFFRCIARRSHLHAIFIPFISFIFSHLRTGRYTKDREVKKKLCSVKGKGGLVLLFSYTS